MTTTGTSWADSGRQPTGPSYQGPGIATEDPLYLQTLGRGLDVLTHLSGGPLTLREIGDRLGVNRSSAYRLVQTLVIHGMVAKDSGGHGAIRLTPRLWELGVRVVGPAEIRSAAGREVRALSEKYGETVHLATYHRGDVVYIDKADGWHPIGSYTQLGGRAPAYCVATGKTLLAHQPASEIERILAGHLEGFTPLTVTSPEELQRELDEVKKQGFALNRGEWRLGVAGVAVPLPDLTGATVAALGFSGPVDRITERRDELLEALQQAATAISGSAS